MEARGQSNPIHSHLINSHRQHIHYSQVERKDLGDHLSIYPKNMFDEAIKEWATSNIWTCLVGREPEEEDSQVG